MTQSQQRAAVQAASRKTTHIKVKIKAEAVFSQLMERSHLVALAERLKWIRSCGRADFGAGGVNFTRNPTFFKARLPGLQRTESLPIDNSLFVVSV